MRGAEKSIPYKIGAGLIILVLLLFALFPLFWILLTSLKSQRDLFAIPPMFFFKPVSDHWTKVLVGSEFLRYYMNSLIIAISTVVVVMIVATMAAYGLERGSMGRKVKENLAFFILSQRMMPPVAIIIPVYLLLSSVRLLDKLQTLIIMNVAFNLPLSIWMIRGFLQNLPMEIEEAAIVDGCSHFGAFTRVGIPQMLPGLLSTALFTFIYTINEFFFCPHPFRHTGTTGLGCGSAFSPNGCSWDALWRSGSRFNSHHAPKPCVRHFHAALFGQRRFTRRFEGIISL